MNPLSKRAKLDRHSRRLLVDEAEWRDRLNQLADMRRAPTATPIAAGAPVVGAADIRHGGATGSP
jgi:hypothetical protein